MLWVGDFVSITGGNQSSYSRVQPNLFLGFWNWILSLGDATDTYRRWIKDWGYEFSLLPIAACEDRRLHAIQIDVYSHADSPVYEILWETNPGDARMGYQNLKDMLVEKFSVDK